METGDLTKRGSFRLVCLHGGPFNSLVLPVEPGTKAIDLRELQSGPVDACADGRYLVADAASSSCNQHRLPVFEFHS